MIWTAIDECAMSDHNVGINWHVQVRPLILILADCWQIHEERAQRASFAWNLMFSRAWRSCGGRAMVVRSGGCFS